MKKAVVSGFVAALLLAVAGTAPAGEITFTKPPRAVRRGEAVRITFAVSTWTDVEVAVLDAKGKVVRHLAAGMLGKNAPAPLRKTSLSQELIWDGTDDLGRPAKGGPFRVRVAAGLEPTFDRLIGYNPGGLAGVRALAVAPDGTLYVFHCFGSLHPGDGTTVCVAFDRKGRYLRQVIPYPADLPEERLEGLKRLAVDGRRIPFIYQGETRSIIPGLGDLPMHRAIATSDGRIAFVGHQEWIGTTTRYNHPGIKQLTVVMSDGGVPEDGLLRTVILERAQASPSLALSPDEKTIYAAGLATGSGRRAKALHAVYRFGWHDEKPTPFVGNPGRPGSDRTHLNRPTDVAVDAKGNVYVADYGNDRVAVFTPAGAFLGAIPVGKPYQVEVHRKTGAVYVLGGEFCGKLSRFASLERPGEALSVTLPRYKNPRYRAILALDDGADAPLLYVAPNSNWAGFKLLRIEDRGDSFENIVDIAKLSHNSLPNAGPRTRYRIYTAGAIMGMALDRRNRRLYLNRRMFDLESEKWGEGFAEADGGKEDAGAFGLDGLFYSQLYPNRLRRLDPAGKFLPFPKGVNGEIRHPKSLRLRGRGVTADPSGNVYVLRQKSKEERKPGDASDANTLALYAPDGSLEKFDLVDSEIRGLNSVKLDYRGDIYLAVGVRPRGKLVPETFAGIDRGRVWKYGMNSCEMDWYPLMYGSIVKFGPEGGAVRKGTGGVPVELGTSTKKLLKHTELKGAQWIFFGASPVPSWRLPWPDTCLCESPRIDVDGFGRSFFPDALRFRVGVLDAAGNLVRWFGSYGNQDSAGPKSAVPAPEIPFYWPYFVCVEDGFAYVGDRLNRRVVAVRLEHRLAVTRAVEPAE